MQIRAGGQLVGGGNSTGIVPADFVPADYDDYQNMLDQVLNYRKHVLAIFDSLVFRDMEPPQRIQ